MSETIIAQNAPISVAIDIAKARHEVLIAIPGKKRRRRLTVLNQLDDFKRSKAMGLRHIHATVFGFELVERR